VARGDGGRAVTRARGLPRPYLVLGLALALALLGGATYTLGGVRSYLSYQRANAQYQTACDSLISWEPPAEILTGFYPNQRHLVTVRYRSETPQVLRIAVTVPSLTQAQEMTVHAGPVTQTQDFWPPLLSSAALDALVGPQKRVGRIELTVRQGGDQACLISAPVTLYSRQMIRWVDASGHDNYPYLAGWVTPHASVIGELVGNTNDQIRNSPREYAGVGALVGYAEGRASPSTVVTQVNALFDTLRQVKRLSYASNLPFLQDDMQVIRLPRDILTGAAPTAMCVESTVIMASAVEQLGMRPYVVFIPDHVFLGVATDDHASAIEYWETSDLNDASGASANIDGDNKFEDATRTGLLLYRLDIRAARAQGILPME
jgi:hypothetical protein